MIRQQVEGRIAELEAALDSLRAEHVQLEALAATFSGGGAPVRRAAPRRRRPPAAGSGRDGAAGGGRSRQALALIGARPGITAADLAVAMGISRNYLYRVLPKLQQRGVIRKQGRGYELASG
jgi:uncharacterized membrane protein